MTQQLSDPQVFVDRLKQAMKERDLQQKDLASITGLGLSTIKRFTAPNGRMPGQKNLSILAKALEVSEEWLTGRTLFQTKEEEIANRLYQKDPESFKRGERFVLYVRALEMLGYDVMPLVEAAEEHENGLAKILYDIDKYIDLNGNRYLNRKEVEDNGTDNQHE